MAMYQTNEPYEEAVKYFTMIQNAFKDNEELPEYNLKMQQILCWCHLLSGRNVIGVLPTGYGKSLIFQLLPSIHPARSHAALNIVLVVGPLNSIMADQIKFLEGVGITCGIIRDRNESSETTLLFPETQQAKDQLQENTEREESEEIDFMMETLWSEPAEIPQTEDSDTGIPRNVKEGKTSIVFGHPEAFLSSEGRNLLRSSTYQNNVIAITIDEAHCMETW